jgi:molybdate transport system substrate-binding protein
VALMALLVAACSAGSAAPLTDGPPVELSVLGAASLKDALTAIKSAYEAAVPGITLTMATDASSTLRTQIEQGAPADIFLSADQQNPTALVDNGVVDGNALDFARNQLTIIVPADNPAAIASPADLGRPGLKVIAAGDSVPITRYAKQAVANLAGLAGYPAGFADAYAGNVVSKEENVKAVVSKIELGEGDAAIVYATDALASTKVSTIQIPTTANVIAAYAGVVLKASAHATEAHAFLDWLAGPGGAAILAKFGFLPAT